MKLNEIESQLKNDDEIYNDLIHNIEQEKLNILKNNLGDNYVNNEYLKGLIVKYNQMNYNDDGFWCEAYLRKLEKKYNNSCNPNIDLKKEMKKNPKKYITKEKYEKSKKFILKKMDYINTLRNHYYNEMTKEEQNKFNIEFDKVKRDICEEFMKVIEGRVISFKLVTTKTKEDIDDIKQDALFSLFTYINRFDGEQNTSAFAYVTQQITNSILLSLDEAKKHSDREITGLDFYDNLNTIDDFRGNDEYEN